MRIFFVRVVQFIAVFALILLVLVLLPFTPVQRNSLYYSRIDKDLLLGNAKGPRIIFVGGSNISFGLNCKVFEDSLGLNPINTGIDAGTGLIYMLDHTINQIRKGDVVVIIPEYDQFFDDFAYGGSADEMLIESTINGFSNILALRKKQIIRSVKYIPSVLMSKLRFWHYLYPKDTDGVYTRGAFNKYGDAVAHWKKENEFVPQVRSFGRRFNPNIIQEIQAFNNNVLAKGAQCVFTFPCIQQSSYNKCFSQIAEVDKEIRNSGIKVVGSTQEYAFSDEYMFNTIYHLNKKGVDIRTAKLFLELKQNLLHGR